MTDSSTKTEESPQKVRGEKQSGQERSLRFALVFSAGCFALAYLAIYLQNLRPIVLANAALFDSNAYLMSTKNVLSVVESVSKGTSPYEAIRTAGGTFMFDGPVLPSIGAIFFSLIGKQPDLMDMRAPLVMEGFFHACTAALMAVAGWRLTGRRLSGLCAGLLYAIWPASISGASRFLTETITTFFMASALVAGTYIPKARREDEMLLSPTATFIFGFAVALLMLVKPALAPGALLAATLAAIIVLLSKVQRRSLIAGAIAGALGFLLIFLPWLMITKIATGHFQLLPQRMPTFNMAAGQSPETDGWSALPETPLVKAFSDDDGTAAVAIALYKLNPGDFYGRMARKPLRLFQFPWNDCKVKVLGLPLGAQIVLHQYLVLFGLFGLLAFICLPLYFHTSGKTANQRESEDSFASPPHPEIAIAGTSSSASGNGISLPSADAETLSAVLSGTVCAALILGHLTYLPFVADSRYGTTAIPCLVLLALWCLTGGLYSNAAKYRFLRLLVAATFIMLAFSLKYEPWRSLFATGTSEIYTASIALGSLLLFIGCLLAVRTLLGPGRTNVAPKVLALLGSYLALTLFLAASLAGKEVVYDWETKLDSQEELCRSLRLPADISTSENALVLVNLRGDWRAAQLKVNGQEVFAPPLSIIQANSKDLSDGYRTFANIFQTDTGSLEQWRAFSVPAAMLKPGSENSLSLSRRANTSRTGNFVSVTGSTIRGADQKSTVLTSLPGPSIDVFSPTKLCNNPLCLDPRVRQELPKSVLPAICTRKNASGAQTDDLSDSPGTQRGQYHMFLLARKKGANEMRSGPNAVPIYMTGIEPIPTKSVPNSLKQKEKEQFFAAAPIEKGLGQKSVRIKWGGEINCPSTASVDIYVNDSSLMSSPVEVAAYPSSIDGSGARKFSVEAMARSNLVLQPSAYAMIKISSDRVPLSISNLRLELEPQAAPALTISDKRWY